MLNIPFDLVAVFIIGAALSFKRPATPSFVVMFVLIISGLLLTATGNIEIGLPLGTNLVFLGVGILIGQLLKLIDWKSPSMD